MLRQLFILAMIAGLTAPGAGAEAFRRIEEVKQRTREGQIYLQDWDEDGAPELILRQTAFQGDLCMGCQDLDMVQVYKPQDGQWAAYRAFIEPESVGDDLFSMKTEDPDLWNSLEPIILEGDFNQDGVPDRIATVPKVEDDGESTCTIRFEQGDKIVADDYIYGIFEEIQWLRAVDLDGDGAQEIAALARTAMSGCYMVVYGTENSRWKGATTVGKQFGLGEALQFIEGVRAASPEGTPPVSATLSAVSVAKQSSDKDGSQPATYRFRVEFSTSAAGANVDIKAWRDYFMKWGTGYVVRDGESSLEEMQYIGGFRATESGDNALELETEFSEMEHWIDPGSWRLWIECPYVEPKPNPFGWIGTLQTPRIGVEIADWRIKDSQQGEVR